MTGIEGAAIALGAAVVKSASRIWLGDRRFAADMSAALTDALAGQLRSTFERRRVSRFFDDCADIVAKRLVTLLEVEFWRVPAYEREAAVLAVSDTFTAAPPTDEVLFQSDLDARLVERQLRPAASRVLSEALLSEGGQQIYWLVLRESCAYLVEVVTSLPRFGAGALTELLRRETLILSTLSRVLERLPQRRGVDDFSADYRRVVANRLDRMELLGVTLADANRRYPLSVAYIDLAVLSGRLQEKGAARGRGKGGWGYAERAERVLAAKQRTLIIGPAGSGKTTLLHWLAVRSANADFKWPLGRFNGMVPFFIPLRRYVDRHLPAPEEFPVAVGANVVHEMPSGWVHDLLRSGRALILVDGIDEMPASQRHRVERWLDGLVGTFPEARYVVSSRPAAIADRKVARLGFTEAELQPMSATDRSEFIRQWHEAVGSQLLDADEKAELAANERTLVAAIDNDRHLRGLAVTPLLCALLCALNRERKARLPSDRMEAYAAALDMLLDRRDRERGVASGGISLSGGDKVQLLQDIAFWFVRNGWSDAPRERVIEQVARTARQLRGVTDGAADVYRILLERSGLLREPTIGQVDFLHRTFQEYLAGKAAMDSDEVGLLVNHAADDQWREVVVMAAGHARPEQCAELLRGLLAQAAEGSSRRGRRPPQTRLLSLMIACAYTARRIDPRLRAEVDKATGRLLPPSNLEEAEALAGFGEDIFGMLRDRPPRTAEQAVASIKVVSTVGGAGAMTAIAEILGRAGNPRDLRVPTAALQAWRYFRPDEYVARVLTPAWPREAELNITERVHLDLLHRIDGLASVRCDLDRFGTDDSILSKLAASPALRSVTLGGCGSPLDLSPLLKLPQLERLVLDCSGEGFPPNVPPEMAALAGAPRLQVLSLRSKHVGQSLHVLAHLGALRHLALGGCDDLASLDGGLMDAGPALQSLSLQGFLLLETLSGIRRCASLKRLELRGCPRVHDLAPLASLSSLQVAVIGIDGLDQADLGPLARLPALRELVLLGGSTVDLTPLRGNRGLLIRVPAGTQLIGEPEQDSGVSVHRFNEALS